MPFINRQKYVDSEEFIHAHLSYDRETGLLTWIKRPHKFSKVRPGDIAGCKTTTYIKIKVEGRQLYGHWVAWFLVTGEWPKAELDHENLDKQDNRFDNLRSSTRAQNSCNRKPFSKTGEGLKGAYTHESMNGRWFGQIVVDGVQKHLGRFDSEKEAHEAYVAASRKYHGEFGRT